MTTVGGPDEIFAFSDRKEQGRFPVTGFDGTVVAWIATGLAATGFTATDGYERPLCAGSARLRGFSRTWTATGPYGRPLLSLRSAWTGTKAAVTLERGWGCRLSGSGWRRDFTVCRDDGTVLLQAVPHSSAWSFHPHDYLVARAAQGLDLAELVAVVQIWRMVKKQEAASV